jgi:hypothetical protein
MTFSSAGRGSSDEQDEQVDQESADDLRGATEDAEGPMVGDDPVADEVVRAEPDPVEPPD